MVYIASAFRGNYEENTENAVSYCAIATEKGVLPIAPHLIFSRWCKDDDPILREKGLQLGLELLSKCEELWVCGKVITEGMRGEIELAKQLNIPMFHIKEPHIKEEYPLSADGAMLLSSFDTEEDNENEDYTEKMVVLSHTKLKEEYRTSANQIWVATHGPGCNANSFTGTVHLTHIIDGDTMCVHRNDILGVAKVESILTALKQKEAFEHLQENEDSEDMSL